MVPTLASRKIVCKVGILLCLGVHCACGSAEGILHSWTGHRAGEARDAWDRSDAQDGAQTDPAAGEDAGWTDPGGRDPGGTAYPDGFSTEDIDEDAWSKRGIWFDSTSQLTWQNPPVAGNLNWSDAKTYCALLELAGKGWRLPTIGELRTLVRGCAATEAAGSCGVTDGCLRWSSCRDGSCDGCALNGGPAGGCYWPEGLEGGCYWYWSSSPVADYPANAFRVRFDYGSVNIVNADLENRVRCVR